MIFMLFSNRNVFGRVFKAANSETRQFFILSLRSRDIAVKRSASVLMLHLDERSIFLFSVPNANRPITSMDFYEILKLLAFYEILKLLAFQIQLFLYIFASSIETSLFFLDRPV